MASRPRTRRLRRALPTLLATASVALPVSGAARPAAVPAPVPAALAPLVAATPAALDARYAATRDGVREALRTASGHGDRRRADALTAMAGPGRHFLTFDGRDGGRTAEVFGDLSGARRIAVLVPGAGVDLDHYWRLKRDAEALTDELGEGAAVVAWLGYRTPPTVGPAAVTPGRADEAAPRLDAFVRELTAARPGARISLLCHSYGSVVCARGASGLAVAEIVLYGSPGTGASTAAELHTSATVRAGRGGGDWIAHVPHVRLELGFVSVGFGTDPVSPEFGAEVFDAGEAGHSDYLRPGSVSLRSIARIVTGTEDGRA
ncbi:alpha/beta hydrolase family protein [Streptomyces sp. NBC_01754]|uniref:alpha/beta hydrolase n=1 Tax=Streptomyces sp. NBC_01754 TaxID=2975930 RepID=UPI002DD8A7A4|nr:alpha/beta hydrolase [Streptomyces sp. NBC_01754]WSC91583.1 alpha/beta hydrolase family protein [Streptomyces sp. NBC_01754]